MDLQESYGDGRRFDAISSQLADIPWWQTISAAQHGPILELACGTGRIATPLAQQGHTIIGVDNQAQLLALAQSKLQAPHRALFICADMMQFSLACHAGLIIIGNNSLSHCHQEADLAAIFARCAEHIAQDGMIAIDQFVPDETVLASDPNDIHYLTDYTCPQTGEPLSLWEQRAYHPGERILHLNWHHLDVHEHTRYRESLKLRIWYPHELSTLLIQAGFGHIHRFGDYDGSPFNNDSHLQLICAGMTNGSWRPEPFCRSLNIY